MAYTKTKYDETEKFLQPIADAFERALEREEVGRRKNIRAEAQFELRAFGSSVEIQVSIPVGVDEYMSIGRSLSGAYADGLGWGGDSKIGIQDIEEAGNIASGLERLAKKIRRDIKKWNAEDAK